MSTFSFSRSVRVKPPSRNGIGGGTFICPKCAATKCTVLDSRPTSEGTRRRRCCLSCNERFTTLEIVWDDAEGAGPFAVFQLDVLPHLIKLRAVLAKLLPGEEGESNG